MGLGFPSSASKKSDAINILGHVSLQWARISFRWIPIIRIIGMHYCDSSTLQDNAKWFKKALTLFSWVNHDWEFKINFKLLTLFSILSYVSETMYLVKEQILVKIIPQYSRTECSQWQYIVYQEYLFGRAFEWCLCKLKV